MAVASGKDGSITMTGAGSGMTITKWELDHSPNFLEYTAFGDGAPRNEELIDNWTATVDGFLTDGGTPPEAGEAITALELKADGNNGYETTAAVVQSVTTTADAGDAVAISVTIIPNGVAMESYGDTSA